MQRQVKLEKGPQEVKGTCRIWEQTCLGMKDECGKCRPLRM